MVSLCSSPTSPATLELLELNIQLLYGSTDFNFSSLCHQLRVTDAWSHLASITTHPAGLRLQRVGINNIFDDGAEADMDEVLKAVLDRLPLLHMKSILFFKSLCGRRNCLMNQVF